MQIKKAVMLISGGIDSPVAADILLKKEVELIYVHFDNRPLTDERPLDKVRMLIKKINAENHKKQSKLYVIDHGKNQIEAMKKTERRYLCILCRRMMFKTAEKIAEIEKCQAIATGENLGQVASQTMSNMKTITESIKIPVIRPILCNDKQETIDIAKTIGTYEISIMPGICCAAVPKSPATKSKAIIIIEEEKKINVNELIEQAIKEAKIEYID